MKPDQRQIMKTFVEKLPSRAPTYRDWRHMGTLFARDETAWLDFVQTYDGKSSMSSFLAVSYPSFDSSTIHCLGSRCTGQRIVCVAEKVLLGSCL